MKADPFQIGDVLKNPKRFVMPIYQRSYSWEASPHLETFVDQVEQKAELRLEGAEAYPHYMGALLVIPRPYEFGRLEVVDVVDGQQRLTTFQIFAAALKDLAASLGETNIADLIQPHLLNAENKQMREPKVERYKLHPTAYDRALFRDLIDLDLPAIRKKHADSFYKNGNIHEDARLPLAAWMFIRKQAAVFVQEGPEPPADRLMALAAALLEDFRVIVITLGEKDDAQVIFETLNSGGQPLAAMDLVRNDICHRAARAGEDVETLMETRWGVFDKDPFWKQSVIRGRIRKPRIDFFLSDVLAAEEGKVINLTELYTRYKAFAGARGFANVEIELETLLRHAPTYRALSEPEGDGAFAQLAVELEVFDTRSAYPLVFVIAASDADEEAKARCYSLISGFVVRRALCGLNTKAYNTHFIRLAKRLEDSGVAPGVLAEAFNESTGENVGFPDDAELLRAIQSRPQYGYMQRSRLRHIFGQLERASRDKFDEALGLRDDLTIEHILPETWMTNWPLPDGSRAPADLTTGVSEERRLLIVEREGLKHTLGNLTLLTASKNPQLSHSAFDAKKDWLRQSLLKLNQDVAKRAAWDEAAIRERATALHALAVRCWPAP